MSAPLYLLAVVGWLFGAAGWVLAFKHRKAEAELRAVIMEQALPLARANAASPIADVRRRALAIVRGFGRK